MDRMIPKIIHRVVPRQTTELMEICWESSKFYHSDWDHRTHYDDESYGAIDPLLDMSIPGAIKADIIRYFVLHKNGGIYLDSDFQPYRSLEPLLNNKCFIGYESEGILNQAVLGCEVENQEVLNALSIITMIVKQNKMNDEFMVYDERFSRTMAPGPYSVTRAMGQSPNVTRLNEKAFYPFLPWDKTKQYSDSFSKDPEIYGIHWYVKSWGKREWTLPEEIERLNRSTI